MNGLEHLGARIASEQDALRARVSPDGRARLRDQIGAAEVAQAGLLRGARVYVLAATLASAAAVLLFLRVSSGEKPLTVRLGQSSATVPAGTFVEAGAREPLLLRFSDGTRIELAQHSRGRLVELDANGAHVLLESGLAHVHVQHRAHTRYRLSVGPFKVLVVGTRFDVRWNPEADAFELELNEGHVEVSGCAFGPGYQMRAGQRVRASCRAQRFDVSAAKRDTTEAVATVAAPTPAEPAGAGEGDAEAALAVETESAGAVKTRGRTQHAAGAERADWVALAQAGKYVPAFAAAEAAGFETQAAHASAAELAMLADAARYAGAQQREVYALKALRRRFVGTEAAALAAFSLGRLEFDRHGAYQKAAKWFDTYLNEQPSGALSREARGRLIEATVRAGDLTRARVLADSYVRDYPSGPHANLARSLK